MFVRLVVDETSLLDTPVFGVVEVKFDLRGALSIVRPLVVASLRWCFVYRCDLLQRIEAVFDAVYLSSVIIIFRLPLRIFGES